MQNFPEASALLGLGAIFILLFVTIGPIKIVGPFAQLTRAADEARMKQIAVRAFVLAVIAAVVGGVVGEALLKKWEISVPALTLAGGIIFFVIGLRVATLPTPI